MSIQIPTLLFNFHDLARTLVPDVCIRSLNQGTLQIMRANLLNYENCLQIDRFFHAVTVHTGVNCPAVLG